ncbi:MAG: hypothetical protein AB1538_13200, partial [Bacillota bacterium]
LFVNHLISIWNQMNPRQKDCIIHEILFDEKAIKKDTYFYHVCAKSDYYVKKNGIKKSLPFDTDHYLPPYTADIRFAIAIAEKMDLTLQPYKDTSIENSLNFRWKVGIRNIKDENSNDYTKWITGDNLADTICLALFLQNTSKFKGDISTSSFE